MAQSSMNPGEGVQVTTLTGAAEVVAVQLSVAAHTGFQECKAPTGGHSETLVAELSVTYDGQSGNFLFSPTDWTLVDETGIQYQPGLGLCLEQIWYLNSGALAPGRRALGFVSFALLRPPTHLFVDYRPGLTSPVVATWQFQCVVSPSGC
jgi:hypothetical protein